ncbi:glycosyltransferase [Nesterenkonia massiliensis]|uniref:Glycosyltransferase n=1 Tax=Nesterenkonia massiliensis TaxID=1232429 RepID=A0ABT2HT60_9MICC|nr:glycosyltransferase [Nesterenkonia massiliensis]MCT1607887.1 glycosyltransferase [Nesterenkonia massiliensis]
MSAEQASMRARLLSNYLDHADAHGRALERTALRSESLHMRDILAYGASRGKLTAQELTRDILSGRTGAPDVNRRWLATLASVAGLQNITETDTEFAIKALSLSIDAFTEDRREHNRLNKLRAELLFEQRRYTELDRFIAEHPDVATYFYGYLDVDSRSPHIRDRSKALSHERWLAGFNRQFLSNNLLPVSLRPGEEAPFNRLITPAVQGPAPAPGQDPLVTVIMTTYKPVRDDVLQSARSILSQTWQNLELLVVDDASPAEFVPVLDELDALDPRVRVIRQQVNAGTYAARNVGIAQAHGVFITGQDADDWSHPQRIQTQARHLIEDPDAPGNQVYTVNMTEDLVRIRRGYHPFIPSAPTLMVRTHILRELGGYLPARKAADNELRGRVAAYARRPVRHIKDPLIFMRILPDSLSRADFRPGWQHPARRAFWSAYKTWHQQAAPAQLARAGREISPIHIPPRFTTPPSEPNKLDVVIAADWCEFGQRQAAAMEEIQQLRRNGHTVGVLHLENAVHISRTARTYSAPIQRLISAGDVTDVLADEDFHEVALLLVRGPELLQFMPHGTTAFRPGRVVVVADKPPVTGDQVHYVPEDCTQHAAEFFGTRPRWIPTHAAVRAQLTGMVSTEQLSSTDWPLAFDPQHWQVRRERPRNLRPVVGRWGGVLPAAWPAEPDTGVIQVEDTHAEEAEADDAQPDDPGGDDTQADDTETALVETSSSETAHGATAKETMRQIIEMIWPLDGSMDVRLYGDTAAALRLLGGTRLPSGWMAFSPETISRRTYYRSLDYLVHYPQSGYREGQETAILEAMAAGCVVILPEEYTDTYGEAALYAPPHQVQDLIRQHHANWNLYLAQSRRAVQYAHLHGNRTFIPTIAELLTLDHQAQEAHP